MTMHSAPDWPTVRQEAEARARAAAEPEPDTEPDPETATAEAVLLSKCLMVLKEIRVLIQQHLDR